MAIERFDSEHIYRKKGKILVLEDLINAYFTEYDKSEVVK